MENHENAPTNAQILELGALMFRQIPKDLTSADTKFLIENPKVIRGVLRGLKSRARKHAQDSEAMLRGEWIEFYDRVFGIGTDIFMTRIPDEQPGFDRVLFIPEGLALYQAIAACRERFEVQTYIDKLDGDAFTNDRSPESGSYAIRLRNRREADKELKNLSVNVLKERGTSGITLLERLVLELKYYYETGEHLDVENVTLCSGSRRSDGSVPHVYWHDGGLYVLWSPPDDADGYLRSRAVVS